MLVKRGTGIPSGLACRRVRGEHEGPPWASLIHGGEAGQYGRTRYRVRITGSGKTTRFVKINAGWITRRSITGGRCTSEAHREVLIQDDSRNAHAERSGNKALLSLKQA